MHLRQRDLVDLVGEMRILLPRLLVEWPRPRHSPRHSAVLSIPGELNVRDPVLHRLRADSRNDIREINDLAHDFINTVRVMAS